MTFEEYLEYVRPFDGPLFDISTEKKLDFYKEKYRQHLLEIEDDKYFEPVFAKDDETISGQYEHALDQLMGLDQFPRNQIGFLVIPSFHAESFARLIRVEDKYIFELTTLSSSFWKAFAFDNTVNTIKKTSYSVAMAGDSGSKLWSILSNAMDTARKPVVGKWTLDGVVYRICTVLNEELVQVSKHSPGSQTIPGKIIHLMEQLSDCVIKKDETMMQEIINSTIIS